MVIINVLGLILLLEPIIKLLKEGFLVEVMRVAVLVVVMVVLKMDVE